MAFHEQGRIKGEGLRVEPLRYIGKDVVTRYALRTVNASIAPPRTPLRSLQRCARPIAGFGEAKMSWGREERKTARGKEGEEKERGGKGERGRGR